MGSEFDPLTLILLIVAVVVIFKLRSVLGERTGHEQPPQEKSAFDKVKKEQADAERVWPGRGMTLSFGLVEPASACSFLTLSKADFS